MFELKVVNNCPVTRASQGRVTMPQWLIAECVGTLEREKGQEWLILLTGFRSKDGLDVRITGAEVPPDQQRTPTHVHIEPIAYRHSVVGEEHLTEGIVGALHSHNEMAAVFSGTDDRDINQKFEVSIVISSQVRTDEDMWLGFSYQAVGKVKLPCGSLGMVPFKVVPEGVEDWPTMSDSYLACDEDNTSLGDCSNILYGNSTLGNYYQARWAKCDLLPEVEQIPKFALWGEGEGEMASLLPPPHKPKVIYGGWRDRNGEDVAKAYVDAEFEPPESVSVGGTECECCGQNTGHYVLIGKDLICKWCEKFWREGDEDEVQPVSDAAWVAGWDEDRAWQERWAEIAERGGLV